MKGEETIKQMKQAKKYKVLCYMLVDTENQELLTAEEAKAEKKQAEFMQPENIYKIVDENATTKLLSFKP